MKPEALLHKLMDIQDAQSQARYAEARDLTYRLICETRGAMVAQKEALAANQG